MRGQAYAKFAGAAAVAAGLIGFALPAAQAGEVAYCVTCQGPDQTYVCRVTGDEIQKSDALKLYCVVRTAKENKHASCAAKNDIAGCNGVEKVYAYDGPVLPETIAEDPRAKGIADKIAREQKEFDHYEEHKGKSLAAVTGRALSASRRGIRNMRASIDGSDDAAANQSALPAAPPPMDALPERQASAAPSIPLSAAPAAPAAGDLPPSHPSRIKRSAQNVGSFARSSYRCVRSLFRKCHSEEEALPPPN